MTLLIGKYSWYRHAIMVSKWTQGIDRTNGIDLNSWYRIGTPESHRYKRAECCPYAEFLIIKFVILSQLTFKWPKKRETK